MLEAPALLHGEAVRGRGLRTTDYGQRDDGPRFSNFERGTFFGLRMAGDACSR